jgi:hypothetical protein
VKTVKSKRKHEDDDDYDPSAEDGEDPAPKKPKKRAKYVMAEDLVASGYGSQSVNNGLRRRSSRIQGIAAPEMGAIWTEVNEEVHEDKKEKKPPGNRPMVYGAIPGIVLLTAQMNV